MIKKNLIWILWGMWSYASLRAYKILLDESKKYSRWIKNDDFPHIIIDNIPVKELTNNIISLDETVNYVRDEYIKLKKIWVNIFVMACNTMHLYFEQLFIDINKDITVLSLIYETVKKIENDWHIKVWILWSVSTIKNWLYSNALKKRNLIWIILDNDEILEDLNNIIKNIIWWIVELTQKEKELLSKCVLELEKKWVTAIILWCTELPIAFENLETSIKLYDPLFITLTKACEIYYENK